jgi:hypothetical protein
MLLCADAEELSPCQSMLANGALLLRGVPIARTGIQQYHAGELAGAIDEGTFVDDDGMIEVERAPADVFNKRAMASFEGAPVVMSHPDSAVNGDNWRDLAIGHCQNVHRDGDLLIGDLLIHDRRGIAAIRDGGWRGVRSSRSLAVTAFCSCQGLRAAAIAAGAGAAARDP